MFVNYLMGGGNQAQETGSQGMMSYLEGLTSTGTTQLELPYERFVGIVRVEGTIQAGGSSTSLLAASEGYNHEFTMNYIDELIESDTNAGIILVVNSPGGTVYESDELYLKLMEYKTKTERPIIAYFGSEACSGGYYVAQAADQIYANRNCWTGSIGVIISMINYKGLLDELGVKEVNITSGANKAMGSAGEEMTDEERQIFQGMVDEAYEQFVGIVAQGRHMSVDEVKKLADGRIYTAKQAQANKLIDAVGTYEDAVTAIKEKIGSGYTQIYEPEAGSANWLSEILSSVNQIKKSDTQIVLDELTKKGNGGLMYYAETGK